MISRLGDRNNLLKPSNFMNMSMIKGKENKETIRKKRERRGLLVKDEAGHTWRTVEPMTFTLICMNTVICTGLLRSFLD